MKHITRLLLLLILALPLPAMAQSTYNNDEILQINIIAERNTIKAGESIWVATEQLIKEEWHTYWQNPGDSGAKPIIEWDLPTGFTVSEIHWQTPEKIPYPPLLNYGYSHHVTLLQKLTAPDSLTDGEALTLTAAIEVLVCKEECIPTFRELSLTLNNPNQANEDNTAALAMARAKLPQKVNWQIEYAQDDNDFILIATLPQNHGLPDTLMKKAAFIPEEWGLIDNAAPTQTNWTPATNTLTIRQTKGDRDVTTLDGINGVLTFPTANFLMGFEISSAQQNIPTGLQDKLTELQDRPTGLVTIIKASLAAILGGMILNLMPCVFPVLSIKALSLIKIAEHHPDRARAHGLSYGAGVILSFLIIAGILIALQSGGAAIGWGFQLQNPTIIALLAYLLLIIGLNFSGVFEIRNHFGNIGNNLTRSNGLSGAFFTGVLATLVATPCTAPFMGLAMGVALTQPPIIALTIFAMLGFGLALPYMALAFIPTLQKLLPRPGKWMATFRSFLAIPMYASAIWLLWVLSQQVSEIRLLLICIGMIALTISIWTIHRAPKARIIAIAGLIFALAVIPTISAQHKKMPAQEHEFGAVFSPDSLEQALKTDQAIFTEMTAAWCITCKINNIAVISTTRTKALFKDNDVIYLIGDWTNKDADITAYLKSFGRSGVPLYIFYPEPDKATGQRPAPIILPQILTPNTLRKTVNHEIN